MRASLEQLAGPVYRFARRLTGGQGSAEDLAQEALCRAWRDGRRFDDPEEARRWIFRITANAWRDELRRRRVRAAAVPVAAGSPAEPLAVIGARDEADLAMAHLDALPERQRETLYLAACEGLAVRHIAEVLGISESAAKASLSLARQRVRRALTEKRGGQRTAGAQHDGHPGPAGTKGGCAASKAPRVTP